MKVLIGSPVRQEPEILREFLESIRNLWMEDLAADVLFIDDNDIFESQALLKRFSFPWGQVSVVPGRAICPETEADLYTCDERTHHWTEKLIRKVARYKDTILSAALEGEYDFAFLVDSDLVLHPATLSHLASTGKEVISEVYWTKWQPEQETELPQVWLMDEYDMYMKKPGEKLHPEEIVRRTAEFVAQLRQPGIYPVGGLGGCTLIARNALLKGVSFREIPNLSFCGEDRHFCVRAAALGIELWVDTHFPCYHLYRRSDLAGLSAYKEKAQRLSKEYLAKRHSPVGAGAGGSSQNRVAVLAIPETKDRSTSEEVNIHQVHIWDRNWSRVSPKEMLADWSIMDQEIYQILRKEIDRPGQRILEAGSGSGKISLLLAQEGHRLTLIDYSQAALSTSRTIYVSAGVEAEFVHGSILEMPFPDGSFDLVWNAGVLEHFSPEEQRQALAEMRRVCRPSGRIITLNPNARCLLYRFGKWLAEKRNVWPFGYEEPVISLADQFAAAGIEMEREYDAAFRSGISFLGYYPGSDLLVRTFDLWFRSLLPEERELFPGYLRVSVGRRPGN